jgi:hypothetical protein
MHKHRMNSRKKASKVVKNRIRRGWLKNGNPPGDFTKAVRREDETRHVLPVPGDGKTDVAWLGGGLSTGPKTWEGIERIQAANTKHGRYRKAAREFAPKGS